MSVQERGPWDDFKPQASADDDGPWSAWQKPAAPPPAPEKPGLIRSLADIALEVPAGAANASKALADAFGASNAVSQGFGSFAEGAQSLQSPARQAERQQQAQRALAAEQTGSTWEEVKAAGQNFLESPVSATANAAGSLVPVIAGGLIASRFGIKPTAATGTIGAGMGAGAVKGSIYDDQVKRAQAAGLTPEQAQAQATAAQAYSGPNTDQIALGAGLGVLAGTTGVERMLGGGASAIKNRAGRTLAGMATEAVPEAVQGGQERLAANIAAQREGYEAPTWQGVAGQATMEGLASTGPGGLSGFMTPHVDPNAGPLSRAAATAQETGAAGLAQAAQQANAAAGNATEAGKDADPLKAFNEALRVVRTREGKQAADELLYAFNVARNPQADEVMRSRAAQYVQSVVGRLEAERAEAQARIQRPKPDVPPAGSFSDMNEFADFIAQERADLEQRRNPQPFAEMTGVDAGFDPMNRARNQVPPPSGSFGQMNEFADLLAQERADVTQRRDAIAERQAMEGESHLESIQGAIEGNRQAQSAQERMGLLDSILNDPETRNPLPRFESALKKAGYQQRRATPEERQAIERFQSASEAFAQPDTEPSAPNEMDASAMGIRERQPKVRQPQQAPAEKPQRAAFPMTREGAERRAAEQSQATGQAFEVVPHPSVKGRFAVQAVAEGRSSGLAGQSLASADQADAGALPRTEIAQSDRQDQPAAQDQRMPLPSGDMPQLGQRTSERTAELDRRNPQLAPARNQFPTASDSSSLDTSTANDSAGIATQQPTNALLNSGEIGTQGTDNGTPSAQALAPTQERGAAQQAEVTNAPNQSAQPERIEAPALGSGQVPAGMASGVQQPAPAVTGAQGSDVQAQPENVSATQLEPTATQAGQASRPQGAQEGAQESGQGVGEFVTTRTVYGDTVRVRRADLDGDRALIPMFTADGKPKFKSVHRENLDPDGSKQAAQNSEAGALDDVVTTKDGKAFANKMGARREQNRRRLSESHDIVPGDEVQAGLGGFVLKRKAAQQPRSDLDTVAERMTEPTHADPGEAPEAATAPVIAKSMQKSAQNTPLDVKQAKATLLADIDRAIENVPPANHDMAADLAQEKARKFKLSDRVAKLGKGTMRDKLEKGERDAFDAMQADRISKTAKQIGFVTLDVPGDGTFKVVNTVENLRAFADKVKASPGFREDPTTGMKLDPRPAGPTKKEQSDAITKAVKEGRRSEALDDLGNAIEIARLHGANDDPLLERFREIADKDYDAWRAEQDAEEEATRREEGERQAKAEQDAAEGEAAFAKLYGAEMAELDAQAFPTTREKIGEAYGAANGAIYGKLWSSSSDRTHKDRLTARLKDAGLKERDAKRLLERAATIHAESTRGASSMTFLRLNEIQQAAEDLGFVAAREAGQSEPVEAPEITIPYGGSDLSVKLPKPAYEMGVDEVEQVVRDKRLEGHKDSNIRPFRERHYEVVQAALRDGRTVPDDVLADYTGLVRPDLNDDQRDQMADDVSGLKGAARVKAMRAWGKGAGQSTAPTSPEPRAEQGQQAVEAKDDAGKGRAKAKPKLEDFGEKLEGAKKFMRQQHLDALSDDALDIATEPLSKTFPVPNYAKLADEGVPSDSLAFIAVARNAIPAKPRVGYKLKRWVEQVKQLRSLAHTVLSGEVTFDKMQATAEGSSAYANVRGLFYTATAIKDIQPDLLPQAAKWRIEARGGYSIYRDLKVSPGQTVYSLENPKGRDAGIYGTDAADVTERAAETIRAAVEAESDKPAERRLTKLAVYSDRYTKDIFIGFKGLNDVVRLKTGFANATDARSYIAENQDALQATIDEMRAGPQDRRPGNRPRQGPPHRDGDATPEMFASMFSFRGVQFGSYVEGDRRQAELNEAYDALMDLADVLAIPPKALSLNGSLGLAFGARGSGNAKAHFEPGNVVINLTKTKGAGSLAHEWLHALDNYLDRQSDGSGKSTGFLSNRNAAGAVRAELFSAWKAVQKAFKRGGFLERAQKYDAARSKPYWSTDIEMAARSFERYILDRIEQRGGENDYLVNVYKEGGAYPTDAEMVEQGIAAAYDKLFETIDTRETDKGVALFSRDTSSTGTTPDAIWSAVESLVGPLRRRRIIVVQSADVLVEQGILQSRDANGAQAFVKDGKAYFIASNIQPGNERAVFLHEVGAHLGLERILSPLQRSVLLNRIKTWAAQANGSQESRIAQAALRRVEAAGVAEAEKSSELLAYFVEEAVKAGINPTTDTAGPIGQWFKALWAALRTALEKLGLVNASKLTAQDIVNLAHGAANVAMSEDATGGELQLSRADQIDSPAFRKWFGASRVVDEQGRPLVVYHGAQGEFDAFSQSEDGGYHFGTAGAANQRIADRDAEGMTGTSNVMPVYLSIKNPVRMPDMGNNWAPHIEAMKRHGYDGIVYENQFESPGYDSYIAFDPTQIKSATGNSGAFSPSDPRIQFSRAAAIPNAEAVSSKARDFLADVVKRPGTFGVLSRTLQTQYHKATKNPQFKAVWTRAHAMFMDASRAMSRPADLAPDLLPKFDLSNMGKAAQAVFGRGQTDRADIKAVADVLSAGTLAGGAGPMEGVVWNDKQLTEDGVRVGDKFVKLTAKQLKLYKEARAAIDASLDESAAAEAWKLLRRHTTDADMRNWIAQNPQDAPDAVADTLATVIEQETAKLEDLQLAAEVSPSKDADKAIAKQQAVIADLKDTEQRTAAIFDKAATLKEAGYMPLMRFGQFRIAVTTPDGKGEKIAYVSRYESAFEANRARRQLMQDFPASEGFTVGAVEVTDQDAWKQFKGVSPETVMLFAKESGIAADEVMQAWYKEAVASRSSLRRMVHRKGYQGFSDDLPRVLASFITSNGKAAGYAYHLADMQQMMQDETMPGDVHREARELLETITQPTEKGANVRGVMASWYLLGSIASAIVNSTQVATMSLPFLSQFGSKGFAPGEAMAHLARAYPQAFGKIKDKALADAVKRAEEAGIVDSNEVFHLYAEAMKPMIAKLGSGSVAYRARAFMTLWGAPFAIVEKLNRKSTFIAAYTMAKAQGKTDAQAFDFGERAVTETQGIYAVHNRPNWARGAVGGAILTFRQFSIAYLELAARMWQSGPEGKKAAGLMIGILFLTAGLSGLPGEDDLLDILDTFSQTFLGKSTVSKMELRNWLNDTMGKELGAFVNSGVSAFLPLDVSGRMGMGNLLPGTALFKPSEPDPKREMLEVLGVPGSFAMSAIEGAKLAMQGEGTAAIKAFAPKAVQDVVKGAEMLRTGEARDLRGRKIVDVGVADAFWQSIGFNPSVKAEAGRRAFEVNEMIGYNKRKESEIVGRLARGVADRDQDAIQSAQQDLAEWNQRNPETPILINRRQVQQRIMQLQMERSGRIVKMAPPELRRRVSEALEEE